MPFLFRNMDLSVSWYCEVSIAFIFHRNTPMFPHRKELDGIEPLLSFSFDKLKMELGSFQFLVDGI